MDARLLAILTGALLVLGCSRPSIPTPTAIATDIGVSGQHSSLAWPVADAVATSRIIAGSNPLRSELVKVVLSSRSASVIGGPRPAGCLSTNLLGVNAVKGQLITDRICYPGPGPIDPYHELVEVPLDGSAATPRATVPWYPRSFAQLEGGAWLAAYGPDLCGWIELVPGTGSPPFSWPLVVTDDGDPFPVNAALDTRCDNTPIAGAIAVASDGGLAFAASGRARTMSGFGRLDLPLNLYLREPDGSIRRIAEGLVAPADLQFDATGRNLLAVATIGGRSGLWRFARDGTRSFLYEGPLVGADWAPDGSRIAILVRERRSTPEELYPPSRLYVVDAS